MTNFEKCKSEFLIKDLGNGSFCQAIHRVRDEVHCCSRGCAECYEWLKQEYKPQILDKAEKKYLSNIVRPFRDKVERIIKSEGIIKSERSESPEEYIAIGIKNGLTIFLPHFAKGSMYKGMELDKPYTLEELGI